MAELTQCRIHKTPLVLSLAGVPHCRQCQREAAHDTPTVTVKVLRLLRTQIEPAEPQRAD